VRFWFVVTLNVVSISQVISWEGWVLCARRDRLAGQIV